MVLSWLARRIIGWVFAGINRGEVRPATMLDAPDVVLTFPGETSFSGVFHGKAAHTEWERRLVRCGLKFQAEQVVAVGPPWRTTVCVRGRDWAHSPEGEQVYENRFVLWAQLRWGRMVEIEVYEDTEKASRWDRWLEENESRLAAV